MKQLFSRLRPDLLVIIGFLLISLAYFFTPLKNGWVLGGHDIVAGIGQGQEQIEYLAQTGERTRWTNSIFSGMPTYQISPSYGSTELLSKVAWLLGLFTTGPLNYVFLYLLGFYILMRSLRQKPLISVFGAVAWAFSSYFFIIIAAGHIWKVNTLAFVPPTVAGVILAYRGKYLWGGLTLALFTALQVLSNHLQMTYYFLFVLFFIALAYSIDALRKKQWGHLGKATATIFVGGALGALINLPNLYHTWEYTHHTTRGKSELTGKSSLNQPQTDGLDRDYITAWSYGVDESLTLMIPNFKGGGSGENILDAKNEKLKGYDNFSQQSQNIGLPNYPQYWGNQPMTVGPVYVGAIICFLFVWALFLVRGPLKWALLVATMLSFFFAWGHNSPLLTNLFIDYLPMYSKFRTVSSALVIAELTMPLLAMLALARILQDPSCIWSNQRAKIAATISFAATGGVCLLLALFPSLSSVVSTNDTPFFQSLTQGLSQQAPPDQVAAFVNAYRDALYTLRESLLAADAWASFWQIALAAALIAAFAKWRKAYLRHTIVLALFGITLVSLWSVNRRYLNDNSFSPDNHQAHGFTASRADKTILADTDKNYRVLNLAVGNPFNETSNQTAYFHKSIGGYHAAKLGRYQELIDAGLNEEVSQIAHLVDSEQKRLLADSLQLAAKGIHDQASLLQAVGRGIDFQKHTPLLNMLNMKWIILSPEMAMRNPSPMGNAWFTSELHFVPNADKELAATCQSDLRKISVVDQRWKKQAEGTALDSGTVVQTLYRPNELHYTAQSDKGGVVIFSEIYYPGWTATIDGKEVELFRANYVLRAVKVPAGKHEIRLEFRPTSVSYTTYMAYGAMGLLLLGLGFAVWLSYAQHQPTKA